MQLAGLSLAAVAVTGLVAEREALFDAQGYRIARYRAVVPAAPEGVERIDTTGVARLIEADRAILIDVMPAEGGHYDPATGAWRLAEPRLSLPGARWFPEAGRGPPDPRVLRWFMNEVAALARTRPRATLVLFCLADCWMSWNAALRLRRAGFSRIRWYAEGSDGWREAGRTLVQTQPHGKVR